MPRGKSFARRKAKPHRDPASWAALPPEVQAEIAAIDKKNGEPTSWADAFARQKTIGQIISNSADDTKRKREQQQLERERGELLPFEIVAERERAADDAHLAELRSVLDLVPQIAPPEGIAAARIALQAWIDGIRQRRASR